MFWMDDADSRRGGDGRLQSDKSSCQQSQSKRLQALYTVEAQSNSSKAWCLGGMWPGRKAKQMILSAGGWRVTFRERVTDA